MREIMALADRANQYIDNHKPWMLAKQPGQGAEVQAVCTQGLNLFRVLMIYLQPVLPRMAAEARRFLAGVRMELGERLEASARHIHTAVRAARHPAGFQSRIGADRACRRRRGAAAAAEARAPCGNATPAPPGPISIEDFMRVDLRVAKILEADLITGADKLLKLRLDVGELGERQIFAGIRAAYDPKALVGRLIVVVANLEPRKMRFGTSEGMMLAAGPGGTDIFVLSPDSGAAPGMRVK